MFFAPSEVARRGKEWGAQQYRARTTEALTEFVAARYLLSALLFCGIYAAVTALSIPGGVLLTVSGGFLFGSIFLIELGFLLEHLDQSFIYFLPTIFWQL